MNKIEINLEFFAIINRDGQYFRAKGYGGAGRSWVDDIKKAKVYGKIGAARRTVTWFTTNYPDYGTPDILKIIASTGEILNETERVQKALDKKKHQEDQREITRAANNLKRAQEEMERAERNVRKLTKQ